MAKVYINLKTKETAKIEPEEVEEFYGWKPLDEYIQELERAALHAIEDAEDSLDGITITQASVNELKRALGKMPRRE